MYQPTCKLYCSGGGGLDSAFLQAGINVIQSVEIDPIACQTLRMNFSHDIVERDLTTMTVLDQPKSDIVGITFPCTRYSNIASISGTRTGDDLFLHAFRHVALELPEAFFIENVPGMKAYKTCMECFTKIPNYYVQSFCPLDASNWLPQRRKRLIIIATRKNNFITDPTPSSKRVLLRDILEKDVNFNLPKYAVNRITGKYRDKPIISDPSNRYEIAPCAVAHYGKDFSTRMVKDPSHEYGVRPYTVREYARLQGFPDSHQFAGSQWDAYRQIGNAVAIPVGRWAGSELVRYFNRSRN